MATASQQMSRNVGLGSFGKAKDLQKRILFTLFILVVYRVGTFLPVPGIDPTQYAAFFESQQSGMLGTMNIIGGGALERMGIFALNVMPYITASIIIQMMTSASPTLEKLKKEGESGRKQINQYTRYLTLLFALVQSVAFSFGLANVRIESIDYGFFMLASVVSLTGGSMFLMWLGEQVTARGVGNGISLIIFAGIVAELPTAIFQALTTAQESSSNVTFIFLFLIMLIAIILFIVFIERAQRRLLIQYPKRQAANQVAQGQSSFLPMKLNVSGVIPPIFAIALVGLPLTILNMTSGGAVTPGQGAEAIAEGGGILQTMVAYVGQNTPGYIILYGVLIAFFTFFYTSIVFNPEETADNLRKYGGFIPGIRPGKNTAEYLDYVLTRLTVIGTAYLVFVCVLPEFLRLRYQQQIPTFFNGMSLLIIVSVTIDTVTQIQSHLVAHQYENLIKKSKLGGRKK